MDWTYATLPYRTADLEAISGVIRTAPEDFRVEEIEAYPACGHGEHLFLRIEKRLCTTELVARDLSRALRLSPQAVSYAGQKDRQALTVQWFCVPAQVEPNLAELNFPSWHILEQRRHTNRLKLGHLHANRFAIALRQTSPSAVASCRQSLERLARDGAPNYFGPQRFGHALAEPHPLERLQQLRSEPVRHDRQGRYQRRMQISQAQAWLFNAYLAQRMLAGQLDRALGGDILKVRRSGGLFVCNDPQTDTARLHRGEITMTGPIYGHKMMAAKDEAGGLEQEVLTTYGLSVETFAAFGALAPGTRRPLLVYPEDVDVAEEAEAVVLRFTLPAGAYATSILREMLKIGDLV